MVPLRAPRRLILCRCDFRWAANKFMRIIDSGTKGHCVAETLGANFEEFPVKNCGIRRSWSWRADVAGALKGSAVDKAFYEEHRETRWSNISRIDKYLTEGTLTLEEIVSAIFRKSTLALKIVPVLAGSAFKNKGIEPLLCGHRLFAFAGGCAAGEGVNPKYPRKWNCGVPRMTRRFRRWRLKYKNIRFGNQACHLPSVFTPEF